MRITILNEHKMKGMHILLYLYRAYLCDIRTAQVLRLEIPSTVYSDRMVVFIFLQRCTTYCP